LNDPRVAETVCTVVDGPFAPGESARTLWGPAARELGGTGRRPRGG
jgi:hypothetical protein